MLGQKFDLNLTETHIVSDDAMIITENGSRIPAPKVSTYRGTVVGKANSSVTLAVSDDVVIGDINVENKSYFIKQTSLKQNGKVVHVVYSSDAFKDREILEYCSDGDDTENVQKNLPPSSLNQTQISAMLLSVPTVDIMACYDSEFSSIYSNTNTQVGLIFNGAESAFSPANVDLNIKEYKYYTGISNGNASSVLPAFYNTAKNDRDSTNSDLAFLFTGKEMSGNWIGLSYTYTGSSAQAYAVAQMVSAGSSTTYQATTTQKQILTAHELGHIFGATHDEAYSWSSGSSHYYTCMWSPFMGTSSPNYMQNEFSNLNNHGNSSHNNILHIVANKNTIAGFQ